MAAHMEKFYMLTLGRNLLMVSMIILSCQLIVACSTPEKVVAEISSTLGPKCKARFTDDRVGMYSYAVQALAGGGVFALAKEDGKEACGYGSAFNRVTNDQHESVALKSCENERLRLKISNPCRVYARNFNVIWNEALYESENLATKKLEAERLSKRMEELKANPQKNEIQQLTQSPVAKLPPQSITFQQSEIPKAQDAPISRLTLDESKKKCTELGFKPATEGYGKCVLQLSK
jgi:hypothetical protein